MRKSTSKRKLWLCLSVGLVVLLFGLNAALAGQFQKPQGNMTAVLEALSENNSLMSDARQADSLPMTNPVANLLINDQDQALVYIRVAETSDANLQALTGAGADITHVSDAYKTVTAYVAPSKLDAVSSLAFVRNISEATKPFKAQISCSGATTSEGDSQLKADQARIKYGVDGSGVIVGVISDSFNGVTASPNMDEDILSGDLPGASNPCGHTTPVNILVDYTETDASDEGRAMGQIVHDLAPGAQIAFATAWGGLFDFADQIRNLRSTAKADIIVDDVSYYSEPMFQDGPVSAAITEVTADGAVYFTSAGNSNEISESGNNVSSCESPAYRPAACPTVYDGGSEYTMGNDCHNFNTSGTTPYQEFLLADQGYIRIILNWAEPWYGVETDFDFFLSDDSGNLLASSTDSNNGSSGTQTPFEFISYQNTTGSNQTVRLYIARYSGTAAPRLKYLLIRAGGIYSTAFNATNSTDVFGPSIFGHSGADDALSIAAVPYNDASNPESFTSHGYFTVYFEPVSGDTASAALAAPETRLKPDFAATDGGANTFFGQQDAYRVWRFYGTSAAAPHAAAVAALMLENFRNNNPGNRTAAATEFNKASVEKSIEESAATVAGGGSTITGAGLTDAGAAIANMNGEEVTPVIPIIGGGSSSSNSGCFLNAQ